MAKLFRKTKRPCAICRTDKRRVLFNQKFARIADRTLLDGYEVVACLNCGFCFANNIPSQDTFDYYYKKMSKYEHQDRAGRESEYDLARFRNIVSFIQPYLHSPQIRIMEVGCSTGKLLSLLKEDGYSNVLGIDPSPYCSKAANKLYGVEVVSSALANISFPEASFDLIIMVAVLEHICDLRSCLFKLWKMLSPNGYLLVSVPDASRFSLDEDAPFQEFSIEHLNFFGPISLQNLLEAHGFAPISYRQDLEQINYRTLAPVIQALFKKAQVIPRTAAFQPDTLSENELMAYIERSLELEKRTRKIIEALASKRQPLIVWGAGTHTLRLLATSPLSQANIVAFVDANPRYYGNELNGIPIISPADLTRYPQYSILISSRGFQNEILLNIREHFKLKNDTIILYNFD